MGSDLNWKSNPIPSLHGDQGTDDLPDINNWFTIDDNAKRSTGAVGLEYVWKIMDFLKTREDAHCPQFLDMPGVESSAPGEADYESIGFKICCCAIAQLCGRRFFYSVPSDQVHENLRNFQSMKAHLDSFGLQISKAASKYSRDIFVGNDHRISQHPFRALLEYNLLELSFELFKQSSGLKSWEDLIAIVGLDVNIEPTSALTEHMLEITIV